MGNEQVEMEPSQVDISALTGHEPHLIHIDELIQDLCQYFGQQLCVNIN